jgi:hypothetical protein
MSHQSCRSFPIQQWGSEMSTRVNVALFLLIELPYMRLPWGAGARPPCRAAASPHPPHRRWKHGTGALLVTTTSGAEKVDVREHLRRFAIVAILELPQHNAEREADHGDFVMAKLIVQGWHSLWPPLAPGSCRAFVFSIFGFFQLFQQPLSPRLGKIGWT